MRDAFGGAFLVKLLLIFLSIYIAFMAIALNYAKAFRVKNQIITYIEQYEGYNNKSQEKIETYLQEKSYYVNLSKADHPNCSNYGYCVSEIASNDTKGTYYLVETFITVNFPFFNLNFTIPIQGETRAVVIKK